MTVRLLKPYVGRPAGAITSVLDASTEAGLIAAGQASADLTAGVKYYVPKPGLARQAKQIATGSVSLKIEEQCVCTLPEGQVLKITGGTGAVGEATRAGTSDKWAIGAGTITIGPYSGAQRIPITCSAGSIDATGRGCGAGCAVLRLCRQWHPGRPDIPERQDRARR